MTSAIFREMEQIGRETRYGAVGAGKVDDMSKHTIRGTGRTTELMRSVPPGGYFVVHAPHFIRYCSDIRSQVLGRDDFKIAAIGNGQWIHGLDRSKIVFDHVVTECEPPFKIQAGHYYRTRDGRKVGPMEVREGGSSWSGMIDDYGRCLFTLEGTVWLRPGGNDHPLDLIAEWQDEPQVSSGFIAAGNAPQPQNMSPETMCNAQCLGVAPSLKPPPPFLGGVTMRGPGSEWTKQDWERHVTKCRRAFKEMLEARKPESKWTDTGAAMHAALQEVNVAPQVGNTVDTSKWTKADWERAVAEQLAADAAGQRPLTLEEGFARLDASNKALVEMEQKQGPLPPPVELFRKEKPSQPNEAMRRILANITQGSEEFFEDRRPAKDAEADAVTRFATAILHGDPVHRDWLKRAAVAFNAGEPMPPPVSAPQEEKIKRGGETFLAVMANDAGDITYRTDGAVSALKAYARGCGVKVVAIVNVSWLEGDGL